MDTLADRLHRALPQTQCTRCGYADCRGYAQAIADGDAGVGRCPPGGVEGVRRLAALSGQAMVLIDAACGREGPRLLAVVDETACIGCSLCMEACPVDCVVGAPKQMHTVIASQCTGCERCVPACPVDCIALHPVSGTRTGWDAWGAGQAAAALARYQQRTARRARERRDNDERLATEARAKLASLAHASRIVDPQHAAAKRSAVEAAVARARARREGGA